MSDNGNNDTTPVINKDEDDVEVSTYTVKGLYLQLFVYFLAQSGAFFGCFFGIRGPDNEWPHAWWAFGLLGSSFGATMYYANSLVGKIVKRGNAYDYYNFFDKHFVTAQAENFESIGLCEGYFGTKQARFTKSDEYYQEIREKLGRCACCVPKCASYCFREMDQFISDHGLKNDTNDPGV